jgi:hypothetical protein
LAALHNFIRVHDPHAKTHFSETDSDHAPGGFYAGDDSFIPAGTGADIEEEHISEATIRRNKIADEMWTQYQEVLRERSSAAMEESDEDSDEGSDEGSDSDFYV